MNTKKIILTTAAALLTVIPSLSNASVINESNATEVAAISFRGLKIYHQYHWRNLSVSLEYNINAAEDSADIPAVKKHIKAFLEDYSNPTDFWEIVNTKMVLSLSEAFPAIQTMKSSFTLAPDDTLNFPRESTVKYEKDSNTLKETFQFTKLNHLICKSSFRSLDLRVVWNMKENLDPSADYPDYQWVDAAMESFFKEYPVSFTEWKTLKPQLEQYLLERFPTLETVDIEIKISE